MTNDISMFNMMLTVATIVLTFIIFYILKINLFKEAVISAGRMTIQLFLVGIYLSWIFRFNHPFINIAYILFMAAIANYTLIKNSGLRLNLFNYTFPALLIGLSTVLVYFMFFVYTPTPIYDAKYLIPIAGMLLGNSMTRAIVTFERFYNSVKDDSEGFASFIVMGGTVREAIIPYLRTAYKAGISPSLANMATIGIVFLPGMMTGQILGGSPPIVAIKYQITISLAILAATELSTLLMILFSLKKGFDSYGFLNMNVFK